LRVSLHANERQKRSQPEYDPHQASLRFMTSNLKARLAPYQAADHLADIDTQPNCFLAEPVALRVWQIDGRPLLRHTINIPQSYPIRKEFGIFPQNAYMLSSLFEQRCLPNLLVTSTGGQQMRLADKFIQKPAPPVNWSRKVHRSKESGGLLLPGAPRTAPIPAYAATASAS